MHRLFLFSFRNFLFLLACLLPGYGFSGPVHIQKIGFGEGLSDNYVLSIAQDAKGFLWLGTEWGLNRFDGLTFTVYKTDSPGTTITGNSINKILAAPDGERLWIATKAGGLNRFDCSTQQFTSYPTFSDAPHSTQSNGITDLCTAQNGDLWIATYMNGLKRLDVKNDRIIHFNESGIPQLRDYKIWCIDSDKKGNLYIGHWGEGFSVYSPKDQSLKHFTHQPDHPDGLPDNEILDLCVDTKGNVWIATHKGLALYHPETERFTVFRHDEHNPHSLADHDIHVVSEIGNQLWIGTWNEGIQVLDLETADLSQPQQVRFRQIPSNDKPGGLSYPSVVELFQDSFGNVWVGTHGGGINFISHRTSFFNRLSYSPVKGDENGLSQKTVTALCCDLQGQLWIGTGNEGIDVYRGTQKVHSYHRSHRTLPDNRILSSLVTRDGGVWFGTDREGLVRFNPQKNAFERVRLANDLAHRYVRCLYEAQDGTLWVGTNNGIVVYDPVTHTSKEIRGADIHLPNNLIRSIGQDAEGNLWIGSWMDGISIVTPACKVLRNLNRSKELAANSINHIYRDSEHRMWVATTHGITVFSYPFSPNYDHFVVTQSQGLPDNSTRSLAEGKPGEMWITTHAGISQYFVKEKKIENYDHHDGLPLGSFMAGVVARSKEGVLYFGSQEGICYFNPKKDQENAEVPRVVITDFKVYETQEGKPNSLIHIPVTSEIALQYNQNTFTVGFNSLDYALKDQVEYAYSLKGADELWYQTAPQHPLTFRNLAPGKYTLQVKARLRNGEWPAQATLLDIYIAPPLWLTWWAKVIYFALAALLLTGIFCFYKRRLALENQLYLEKQNRIQEQALHEEKLRFYTNITHELRTPLTLITGPLEDLTTDQTLQPAHTKKLSLIYRSAQRLSELIHQVMEFRKSETRHRTLHVMQGDLSELIRKVVFKYQGLHSEKAVSIEVCTETSRVVYYDPEVLTIVLDNLISNALKYTEQGTISVILREVSTHGTDYLEIEVCDTGHGMPEEALDKIFDPYYQLNGTHQASGTGIGLALVKSLVELHEGQVRVKSKLGTGTSFYVRIRAGYSYPEAQHRTEAQHGTETRTTEKPSSATPQPNAPLIVVVEDHTDIREYIAEALSDSFEVLTAKDGQEGLELTTDKMPDLVVSDIMMPGMNGIELCKTLKEDMRTSHIPVILLTAKDSTEEKAEGYSSGADSYLTKPFSAKLLRSRIHNLLESRKKIADYFSHTAYKKVKTSDALNQLDREFLQKTTALIEAHMGSEQLSVAFLAEQVHMSYSTFSRKVKAVTSMTANEVIRKIRMLHAEQLLLSRKYTVSEVVPQVGYSSMAYFREAFKAEFHVLPSEYLKKLEEEEEGANT